MKVTSAKSFITCGIPLDPNSLFWVQIHLDFWFVINIGNLLLALLRVCLEALLRVRLSFDVVHTYYTVALSSSCDRVSPFTPLCFLRKGVFSCFFLILLSSTVISPCHLSKTVFQALGLPYAPCAQLLLFLLLYYLVILLWGSEQNFWSLSPSHCPQPMWVLASCQCSLFSRILGFECHIQIKQIGEAFVNKEYRKKFWI